VKIAGRRVDLAEVSGRLRRLPGVREAWAGVSAGIDPVLGAVVAADRTAAELRAALLADTAAWKIPKKLVVVPALPVTARGKPDTRALQAMAFQARSAVTPKREASISTRRAARHMSACR
jgi:acyl-coenzyme A synthetase/AMP-(fatty) acid ligase